ncbi:MAG TPA: hypothetical protein VIS03_15795 [Kiloniellaceae bacterium]
MTLFRDDRLVALHDLVEACRSSARHCLLAAESMPNDPRCEELRALGEKRTANADFFGARMIAEDDIPGGPPEERSLVETVLARARAVFADEGMDALLADCREQEVAVLQQAEAACHAPLRKDEKAAAKALTDDAGRRLDTLFRR